MDFMAYVPEDLGIRLRAAHAEGHINYSQLFQRAAEAELERITREAEQAEGDGEIELTLQSKEGELYMGVLKGRLIAEDGEARYYRTSDGRVLCYVERQNEVSTMEEAGDPDTWGSMENYIAVSAALGQPARVEL